MQIDTGGPAFPTVADNGHTGNQDGMTLRDYFAAKAAQGICASKDEAGVLINHGYEWVASEAYKIADAMLKARNQNESA